MLSSRSDRTHKGERLSVEVYYPRRYVFSRLVRSLTTKSTILGMLLGFGHSAWMHSSGQRPERGDAAMRQLIGETIGGGAVGLTAGLTGSLAYAGIGGAGGALAGLLGATLVGSGTYAAIPSLAAMPEKIKTGTQRSLGVADTTPLSPDYAAIYTPVVSDETIKEEAPPPAPAYNGPWNDRVVYLGMNPGPTHQATRLLQRVANVTVICDSGPQDQITVNGRDYNLTQAKGRAAFVHTLDLPVDRAAGVRRALDITEPGARDELAHLAQLWAQGEKGVNIPSRLVLAGHSNGDGVWGDDNGSLRLGPLLQLSRSLPHAATQIEDAFVTGCYSGGEVTMDQYLLIFPRAKTIWAYEAQAPGVDNGATIDQGGWERATRGRRADFVPTTSAIATKKLAVWCQGRYHASRPPLTLEQMRGKVQWMEENFLEPALAGKDYTWDGGWRVPLHITDPHTGLVRQYYTWLVRLTQRKDLPDDERPIWVEKKHQAIRLLYYSDTVAPHFAKYFRDEIQAGYKKMGMPAPDYGHITRAEALQAVKAYTTKLEKTPKAAPASEQLGTLLERGIQDLDPTIIPDGWI